jgi:hypothetical protein
VQFELKLGRRKRVGKLDRNFKRSPELIKQLSPRQDSTSHFTMSTTVTTTVTETTNSNIGRLQCIGNEAPFGDFRDDLVRDGYAIIRGAVPADRAAGYVDEMYNWLEGLYHTHLPTPFPTR